MLIELERRSDHERLEREIAALRRALDDADGELKGTDDPLRGLERAEAVRALAGVLWQRHRA